jgi:YD repeat-containing protein
MRHRHSLISTTLIACCGLILTANGYATEYVYDSLNRLEKTIYDDGTAVTYTYDAVSNRTSAFASGAAAEEWRDYAQEGGVAPGSEDVLVSKSVYLPGFSGAMALKACSDMRLKDTTIQLRSQAELQKKNVMENPWTNDLDEIAFRTFLNTYSRVPPIGTKRRSIEDLNLSELSEVEFSKRKVPTSDIEQSCGNDADGSMLSRTGSLQTRAGAWVNGRDAAPSIGQSYLRGVAFRDCGHADGKIFGDATAFCDAFTIVQNLSVFPAYSEELPACPERAKWSFLSLQVLSYQ